MNLQYLSLLAIVQGITEFLPISSSAHLVLLHEMGGATPDDLALDVAVHLGSILAVVLYFRAEVAGAAAGGLDLLRGNRTTPRARLALNLLIATVPALLVGGVIAMAGLAEALRDIRIIGWTMVIFGVLLWWVHRRAPESRTSADWSTRDAIVMGLWQAVALVPGVSRSGISITAARSFGYERRSAARLSMLMSIPITFATGTLIVLDLRESGIATDVLRPILIAALLAFFAAYGALSLMMRYLDRVSFTPYVVYRVILGIALLAIAYA